MKFWILCRNYNKMKHRILFDCAKSLPDSPAVRAMLLSNLESIATINDDALQKRFLKDLIRNYVKLEKKVDGLLKNTLPASVAEALKIEGIFFPRKYTCTILFTDFVGFTKLAEVIPTSDLVATLNRIFTKFDEIIENNQGTKIKTIGDAYMAVFGAPVEYQDHPARAVRAALEIHRFMTAFNLNQPYPFYFRAGIHTGTVMAGVVGRDRMQFDVFGDHVNIAARFESASEKNRINVSQSTYQLTQDLFDFEKRGSIQLKNKADMEAYFVTGKKLSADEERDR